MCPLHTDWFLVDAVGEEAARCLRRCGLPLSFHLAPLKLGPSEIRDSNLFPTDLEEARAVAELEDQRAPQGRGAEGEQGVDTPPPFPS